MSLMDDFRLAISSVLRESGQTIWMTGADRGPVEARAEADSVRWARRRTGDGRSPGPEAVYSRGRERG